METTSIQHSFPFRAILSFTLLSLLLLYYLVQAKVPKDAEINLTPDQITEIETAYSDGFEFNSDDEDPCEKLKLQTYKKLSAWKRQFRRRGFTIEKIRKMLQTGRREAFAHPKTPEITRTKIFDDTGNWIVVDFVDCIIWQIAPSNFK